MPVVSITSASTVNARDIVKAALRAIRVLGENDDPTDAALTNGAEALNFMVMQWKGAADFAPGLKMWSRKRGYVFLQKDQGSYSLGPSGDNTTLSYVSTTISANEAAGQTVLSVTSSTGMTAADKIGIELNSGSIQWTTVSSTGAGTVTVGDALTGAADSGNRVFAYTTKIVRPLSIVTAVLRDTDSNDSPMESMDVYEYEQNPAKTSDGTPSKYFYEPQLTNGVLYLNFQPDDVTKVIRIVFLSDIELFDVYGDTPDYPTVWYNALKWGLAKELAPGNGVNLWTPAHEDNFLSALSIARNSDPDSTTMYFEPGRE